METRALMPTLGRRMGDLREEMDRMFHKWLASADLEPLRLFDLGDGFLPTIDVTEGETALQVTAELPGMEPSDIEIELTKTELILKGEKKLETEESGEGYYRRERRFGSFSRQIPLPWAVDVATTAPEATFTKGILVVKIPKPEGVMQASRKVEIHG